MLLAGGQVFTGGIWVRGNSQGTAIQPIVFRSYGSGKATIQSNDSYGFYAHNAAGIEVRQLAFVGSGRLTNQSSGVIFYLDSANAHLQHLRVDSVEVSGYRDAGLSVGSWNDASGYDDVRITNSQLHANGEAGLKSYAFYPLQGYAHHNWYVGNCTSYDNSGQTTVTTTHTGNGIVLAGIDGAVVEKCTAYHNGWLNANPAGGPVGIWGWSCNNLVIQQCESFGNQSGTTKDGGGFDLDGGCTNSVMQYNYSHDNQGPGYLLAQFPGAPAMHDLTVRYNISQNDARGYGQGAIELWSSGANGGIVRANIYNNSVYLSQPADGSSPKAVYMASGDITGITLRNNIFQTSAGLTVLASQATTGLRLEGNCYWSTSGALNLDWNGTSYNTLAAWRTGTGQETLNSGTRTTGFCADPHLVAAATGAAPLSSALAGYNPVPASAVVGVGLNLAAEFSLDPGQRDFFGNPTPAASTTGNVGASEARGVLATLPGVGNGLAGVAWCQVYPTVVHGEIHVVAEAPSSFAPAQAVELQLFDMLGRQCRRWTQPSGLLRAGGLTLPVAGLPTGQYVLRVQNGTQQLRQSLLVAAE
ncbi:T9SS type A sorting domain-containing protein [Hymenobacter terricola]|uniref:T9SS type A sorting domain-containing protein n=1 Tax=Hymenobacter terricola TaxID=2819236 RepID=UPI001B309BDF|nr:T9SS type A sorting domain-containing protein [Hymenobacter terricola]